jgi:hypothetical protein
MTVYIYTRTTKKNAIVPLYFRFNSNTIGLIFKTLGVKEKRFCYQFIRKTT